MTSWQASTAQSGPLALLLPPPPQRTTIDIQYGTGGRLASPSDTGLINQFNGHLTVVRNDQSSPPSPDSYKALKQLAGIERYRNRDPDAVYREVYARLITTTLVGLVRYAAGPLVKPNDTARQLRHQINFSNAFRVVVASFAQLFRHDADATAVGFMLRWVADSVVAVRPARSFPRKSKNHGPLRYAGA